MGRLGLEDVGAEGSFKAEEVALAEGGEDFGGEVSVGDVADVEFYAFVCALGGEVGDGETAALSVF